MELNELKENLLNFRNEYNSIISNGEKEERKLNEGEENRLAELRKSIDEITEEIENREIENRNIAEKSAVSMINKKINNRKQMKLINLINDVINHRAFDDEVANEMAEMRAEMNRSGISAKGDIVLRTINATTATQGAENVAEDKKSIEVAIRNNAITSKMGASWLGGLVGDVSIPTYAGSSVKWKGETAAADAGEGAFGEVVLTPHRLTAIVDVSKQFLLQDSNDAEQMLVNDLAKAIAEKLDSTIFSNTTGATQPSGLFADSATTTSAATALSAVTYEDILALEEELETKNASNYMFVVNPSVKFKLKSVQMGEGIGMVFSDGEIDGYPTISSNSVVSKGISCIDANALVIGQWGGLDITIDQYTKASDGQVRLVVNAYFDAKMKADRIANAIFS